LEAGGELHSGDLFLCFNGGKHGVDREVCNNFANESGKAVYQKRTVFVIYKEDSIVDRYHKQGGTEVRQDEVLLQISKDVLIFNGRKRRYFDGTNRGSMLGPVALLPHKDAGVWKLPAKEKKEVIGKLGRVPVGGPVPGGHGPPPAEEEEDKNMPKPVFFHAMPSVVAEELIHSHDVQAVIDLTAADGAWAMACIKARKPYVGVVFTPQHAASLTNWLEWRVLQAMRDENDALYAPGLAEALAPTNQEEDEKKNRKRKRKAKTPTPPTTKMRQAGKPWRRRQPKNQGYPKKPKSRIPRRSWWKN
jgi:hypothetical protein